MTEITKGRVARQLFPYAATILSISLAVTLRVERSCTPAPAPAQPNSILFVRKVSPPFEVAGPQQEHDENGQCSDRDRRFGSGLSVERDAEERGCFDRRPRD